jgi:DNA-binding MarR family transcriptional regulator
MRWFGLKPTDGDHPWHQRRVDLMAHRRPTVAERDLMIATVSLLRRLGTATSVWQRAETGHGFTINQALVLHHLVSHGEATPSGLAQWMHVTRGTMTPTLQRLEELDLVTRRDDTKDRRKQWLTATAKAIALAPQVDKDLLHPIFHELLLWPTPELRAFCKGMERILSSQALGGKP